MSPGRVLVVVATCAGLLAGHAAAQEVTLRVHQFLPSQAPIPSNGIAPWAERITAQSDGRIAFEYYPSMQLGGAPAALFDQARDGVVDIVWTVLGYTPGRFPRSEVFELPFLVTTGEATSVAFWDFVEAHAAEEFADVKLLAVHAHGPGVFHSRTPITRLEDIEGMSVRGGSRVISDMLDRLGADPVSMPVPETSEALARGVIDATTSPWEVTPSLRIAELVDHHTGFAGPYGLYTQTFALVMNRASYESLPEDLQAIIDANSGRELARTFGRVMDEADLPGIALAEEEGNSIVTLDANETERWRAAAQPTIDAWVEDMTAGGADGQALVDRARELVAEESGLQAP
ncbi:TRAP transporter substrate-binding protein [Pelagibacterium montanilacus]|uniref:TRAP transporter substrate-binding protein n=1 Tax=Pelagibacterium montanilacus TaxID=2185280 RepID=UPI000F8D2499|nr:TRAP transporter substrate-binding protein [Pelagibacterium montanilacus]